MSRRATSRNTTMREMENHARDAAQFLKAMGNEYRLLILCQLVEGELSVGELNERINLSQSSLSQHLGVLRQCGLVTTRRESQNIYYRLANGSAAQIMRTLYNQYFAPYRKRGGQ